MSTDNDIEYYRSRELHARQMAAGACDLSVGSIHRAMADCYAAKVLDLSRRPALKLV